MAKRDTLKAGLIKKKPIIGEEKADKVVEQIHDPQAEQTASQQPAQQQDKTQARMLSTPPADTKNKEEVTVKTSVDIRKPLFKAMKRKLLDEEMTMREYIEALIEADLESSK